MTQVAAADTLPAAYAPFASVLAQLSEPLRHLLHGQLAQFERIVHVLRTEDMARSGAFEGLGGLTHRGEITHLLQSELLLRSEAPIEFLRRIAEGEALFLEKQYADPGARWVYRAMVSVGPGLLGHGRIVALAAIFFLARVAADRGAAFHWCFLPRADGAVWFDEVSVNTVKRFLRAASFREMGPDDRAAAEATWDELVPDALDGPRRFDWAIGCDTGRKATSAVGQADHALAFALLPPVAGEPRTAELTLRRNGREGARATIRFADDQLCVEALRNPFAQVRALAGPRLGTAIPAREAWEPEHLALANMHTRLIRLEHGLLVLGQATKAAFQESYFVALRPGAELVGARVADSTLSLLVHRVLAGRETLSFTQYVIAPGKSPTHVLSRSRAVPSGHLFRKRSPFAIPPLTRHEGAEFYSTSGHAYQLGFSNEDEAVGFTPLHQAPRTLHATGLCRVVLAQQQVAPVLRVVRNHRTHLDDYLPPPGDMPDQFHGIVYSLGDRSLAYSVVPGEWIVPVTLGRGAGRASAHVLPVAAHEMPLMMKVNSQGEAIARLWSDARYGGEGLVRWVRHDGGRNVQTSAPLDLGPDAGTMARLLLADDGLWGVTLDAAGVPANLLRYRRNKREQRFMVQRYDLAELAAAAAQVDPEADDAAA